MDSNAFVVIQHWMIELGLKGNELLIFAAIYGFSQSESGMFAGRLTYFTDMFKINYSTVIDVIKKLLDRGLIEKHDGTLTGRWAGCHTYTVPKEVLEIPIPKTGEVSGNPISGVGNSNREVSENPIPGVGKSDSYTINNNITGKDSIDIKEGAGRDEKFNLFWNEYPKHEAKQNAMREFEKLAPDDDLFETMMAALRKVKKSKQWQDVQYIPLPATWIRQRRWEDETEEIKSKDNIKGEATYDIEKIQREAEEIKEFRI